jgi:hypothetical protein
MKTTLEIPDALFRKVKSKAAERGQTLKEFVNETLQEKLVSMGGAGHSGEPRWMQGFGKLRGLHKETTAIEGKIGEAFEVVEPEDQA